MRTRKEIRNDFNKIHASYYEKHLVSQALIIELLMDIREDLNKLNNKKY